jgi:hypothetical protein
MRDNMNKQEIINGHNVNVVRSKSGIAREACVMVGDNAPGMRLKDGAGLVRKQIRKSVAEALCLPLDKVSASAVYTCLLIDGDVINRIDDDGKVIGTHPAVTARAKGEA